MRIEVSVIIVAFKAPALLQRCLDSVPKSSQIEVIVIDNTVENRGFAKAVNMGVRRAKGKYIFILNPDCVVNRDTIPRLIAVLKAEPQIFIVGPQLRDEDKIPYLSYTKQPTPVSSLIVYSWINKWFPRNKISLDYWYKENSLNEKQIVESISGAAMMMRRADFMAIKGFDERFFMYWEDYDLCRRVLKIHRKIVFYPDASVIHKREGSTIRTDLQIRAWFMASRRRYFQKYFGQLIGAVIHYGLRLQEEWQFTLILIVAGLLRFWGLPQLMPFLGDQGRDSWAAFEALRNKQLPLLGIESSIPRFAQGPIYVWMLMTLMFFKGYDPVWAGLSAAVLGMIAVALTYRFMNRYFSRTAAWISTLIMATSPLVVAQSRLAFMTNPIPLMSLLFLYALNRPYRRLRDIFWVGFTFSLLFQFELAVFPLVCLVFWYFWKWRNKYSSNLKVLGITFLGISVGLLPQIIYDLTHSFKQLGLFLVWVVYRVGAYAGLDTEHAVTADKLLSFSRQLSLYGSRYFSWGFPFLTLLFLPILGFGLGKSLGLYRKLKIREPVTILWLWTGLLLAGFMIHSAPSEAYFPALFMPVAGLTSWAVTLLKGVIRKLAMALIVMIALFNSWFLISHDMLMTTVKNMTAGNQFPYGIPLNTQKRIVREIQKLSNGDPIKLNYQNEAGIPHFTDGFRYLYMIEGGKLDNGGKEMIISEQLLNTATISGYIYVEGVYAYPK